MAANPAQTRWNNHVKSVVDRTGLTQSFIKRSLMPAWWTQDFVEDETTLIESVGLLARALQVKVSAITNPEVPLSSLAVCARCKGAAEATLDRQAPTRVVVESFARNLISLMPDNGHPIIRTALDLRDQLLATHGRIDLEGVARLCWELGVPVAHLRAVPNRRPDAMAVNIDGRCAIVLLRNRQHSGWQLFDLAHELGHVMLQHVQPGQSMVDGESLKLDSAEETAANEFAFELLTGEANFEPLQLVRNATLLHAFAKRRAMIDRIDPQWLILASVYRWGGAYYGLAQNALNTGWPDDDGRAVLRRILLEQARAAEASVGTMELLESLTGGDDTADVAA